MLFPKRIWEHSPVHLIWVVLPICCPQPKIRSCLTGKASSMARQFLLIYVGIPASAILGLLNYGVTDALKSATRDQDGAIMFVEWSCKVYMRFPQGNEKGASHVLLKR